MAQKMTASEQVGAGAYGSGRTDVCRIAGHQRSIAGRIGGDANSKGLF